MAEKDAKGRIRVFVYGTLKGGDKKNPLPNNMLLRGSTSEFLGYDSMTEPMCMVSLGGLPAVVYDPEKIKEPETIHGEVWAVDEETLAACDLLEGHPNLYKRAKFHTDQRDLKAWIYTVPWGWTYKGKIQSPAIWRPTQDELTFWAKIDPLSYGYMKELRSVR